MGPSWSIENIWAADDVFCENLTREGEVHRYEEMASGGCHNLIDYNFQ